MCSKSVMQKMVVRVWLLLIFTSILVICDSSPTSFTCYIKNKSTGKKTAHNICSVGYLAEGCHEPMESSAISYLKNDVRIVTKESNATTSYVQMTVPITVSRTMMQNSPIFLSISGVDFSDSERCVRIQVDGITGEEGDVELIVDSLLLPLGSFHVTGYYGSPKNYSGFFVHRDFKIQERYRRSFQCRMVQCTLHESKFYADGGIFRFRYLLEEDRMCEDEDDNKVTLYKLNLSPMTEEICNSFNNTADPNVLMKVVRWSYPKELDGETIEFPNTEKGCYSLRAGPACYLGFLWFDSYNIIDMRKWNTTILIVARNEESSLSVSWAVPEYPHNFTNWQLKLWSLHDHPINCNGGNPMDKLIRIFPVKNIVGTNTYSFSHLKDGHYCVRLTALDPRCPENDCGVRSSLSAYLNSSDIVKHVPEGNKYDIPIIIISVASILIGIGFGIFFFRHNIGKHVRRIPYDLVSEKPKQLSPIKILFIWTKYSRQGTPVVDEVIEAFKELIQDYANCQIVILASDGAVERQKYLHNPNENEPLINNMNNGLDDSLFSYVLHFINESLSMSSDYSRMFTVCVPDLYPDVLGLDGLVNDVRFNIPSHIKELTSRLHGLSLEASRQLREPTQQQLSKLMDAIANARESGHQKSMDNNLENGSV